MFQSKFFHLNLLKTFIKNSSSKFSNFKFKVKSKNKLSATNILLSSAVFGVTFYYIVPKQKTVCESLDINDSVSIVPDYDCAISKSRDLLLRLKDEMGIPGMVVGVSIDGQTVWTEGIGYADVENRVLCSADTVMRIASISKSITMAAVAKLWEQKKLDMDKAVQYYVPDFPEKTFNGKPVTITCRLLVSHLGGIRHYDKVNSGSNSKKIEKGIDGKIENEFEHQEYHIKEHYKDVKTSLKIFKDDPLIQDPGSKFHYSTHGWTLVSAIVEAAAKEDFSIHMTKLFKALGMINTYLDIHDVIIYKRSRNYVKNKKGELLNAPYVDNSYKWAGGGFLSTAEDLLRFGNAMLYSLQFRPSSPNKNVQPLTESKNDLNMNIKNEYSLKKLSIFSKPLENLPGFLKTETVEAMWTPVTDIKEDKYGMGWFIKPESNECMFCEEKRFCVYHTGGAVGASSVLFIVPEKEKIKYDSDKNQAPKGIIVVMLTNMESVKKLTKTASNIAQFFRTSSYVGDEI